MKASSFAFSDHLSALPTNAKYITLQEIASGEDVLKQNRKERKEKRYAKDAKRGVQTNLSSYGKFSRCGQEPAEKFVKSICLFDEHHRAGAGDDVDIVISASLHGAV